MNELITATQTPIEIALQVDGEGRTTARKLYEFLELGKNNYSRWCKTNILENAFAEENIDFMPFLINEERNPKPTTDYKLTASFAKKLAMGCQNKRGEEARIYFIAVEDKLKEIATTQPSQALTPELQMIKGLFDNAVSEREARLQQAEEIEKIKKEVVVIKEQIAPAKQFKIAPVQTELTIETEIFNKTLKKERVSTEQIATMYSLSSMAFYDALSKLGFVVPGTRRGWLLHPQYENKGIGFSERAWSEYPIVTWSEKGVKLIRNTLKNNGVSPTKRLPQKKKRLRECKGLI